MSSCGYVDFLVFEYCDLKFKRVVKFGNGILDFSSR